MLSRANTQWELIGRFSPLRPANLLLQNDSGVNIFFHFGDSPPSLRTDCSMILPSGSGPFPLPGVTLFAWVSAESDNIEYRQTIFIIPVEREAPYDLPHQ